MFSEKNDLVCAAFVSAREHLKNPYREAQAQRGKYAKLEMITSAVNPILVRHGLTFTQSVIGTDASITVRTTLIHQSGQYMWTDSAPFPLGQKRDPHTVAGATTYAKRYGLLATLGIEHDLDDDGKMAMEAFNEPEPSDVPESRQQPIKEQLSNMKPPSIVWPKEGKTLQAATYKAMLTRIDSGEKTVHEAVDYFIEHKLKPSNSQKKRLLELLAAQKDGKQPVNGLSIHEEPTVRTHA